MDRRRAIRGRGKSDRICALKISAGAGAGAVARQDLTERIIMVLLIALLVGLCATGNIVAADDAVPNAASGRPAISVEHTLLDLSNADKIVFYGVSGTASAYALRGKSWVSKLAQQLNYICLNQGRSTQMYDEYAFNIRDGNLVGCAPGVVLSDLHPTYIFLVSSIANPGIGGWGGPPETWDSTLIVHSINNAVNAVRSLGALAVIGTDYSMSGSAMLDSLLFDYAAQNGVPYAGIGNVGEYVNCVRFEPYWPGNHPATRSNALNTEEWLYFLSQFPPPLRCIKIFRKRSAFPLNGDVNRLNYDDIAGRAKKFQEIDMGDSCLKPNAEKYYDRLDEYFDTGFVSPNEYTKLIAGMEGVRFDPDSRGDAAALLDFTLSVSMPTQAVICVKSSASDLAFYVKDQLARLGELKYIKGGVFAVDKSVFDTLDDSYVGLEYANDQLGVSGDGVLVYQGKYQDYNVGHLVCLTASTTVTKRNWREQKPGVLKNTNGHRDIPHLGFVHLRKDYQFFHSLRQGFGEFVRIPAEWSENGYWTIRLEHERLRACTDFDNIKLLVVNHAGFALEDVFASYSGGVPKTRIPLPLPAPKRQYVEKLPVNLILPVLKDSGWEVSGASNAVSVAALPVQFADYPPLRRGGGYTRPEHVREHGLRHCNLTVDAAGSPGIIHRTIRLNNKAVGYRKMAVRVIARVYPPNYITRDEWHAQTNYIYNATVFHNGRYYRNKTGKPYTFRSGGARNIGNEPAPDSEFWAALDDADHACITDVPPVTPDSYDLGTLCIGLKTPDKLSWKLIKRVVQIGWSEIYVESWLPPFVDKFDLALFKDPFDFVDANYHNHKFPLQIFYISVQIENE